MRVVLQRVREAGVSIGGSAGDVEIARIGPGLLVLVGFAGGELDEDLAWVAEKVLGLRVFGPSGGFDRSVMEIGGEILVVSQFTLLAGLQKGRRPDFAAAAAADAARPLYEGLVSRMRERHPAVFEGRFGEEMRVRLVNDGPATFVLDR